MKVVADVMFKVRCPETSKQTGASKKTLRISYLGDLLQPTNIGVIIQLLSTSKYHGHPSNPQVTEMSEFVQELVGSENTT